MRLLGIALTALLLAGCAVVPLEPVAYAPGPFVPEPAVNVRIHYSGSHYTHTGYRPYDHHNHR